MYYKVVLSFKSGLRSACTGVKHAVQYIPNEWTEPTLKGSKLYVFESLQDAVSFADDIELYSIWECEAEDIAPFKACVFSDVGNFWKEYNTGLPITGEYTKGFPSARLASKVKLTKCIRPCST